MTAETAGKKSVWIYGVLFASLICNVFLAGVVMGRHTSAPAGLPIVDRLIENARNLKELPPETRDKVRAAVKQDLPHLRALIKKVREKRAGVRDVLAQPDFDQAALDKAFEELFQAVNDVQREGQDIVRDVANALTPEERAALLKAMPRGPAF